jgi:putative SOS response-associated peptidase YedK
MRGLSGGGTRGGSTTLSPRRDAPATVTLLVWWRSPLEDGPGSTSIINARAESITDKPTFRQPIRFQRCLVPASAFYEWQGTVKGAKTKMRIGRRDGEMFGMAGLYDTWKSPDGDEIQTCAIITCAPNALMAPIHNRMSVILLPEDEQDWLNPDLTEPDEIQRYLRPYPDDLLEPARAS